ncbi:nitrate reductase molybdenum cofactor assembly chaperone [Janthinobacterium sp.]|uniref:nitrate reductase molybdenum cofactor assembly chaperone n=1 Tax=Janthinobacterium sp. TaxID=1871054 RepID=UPI00293D33CB|nr:nitrate reductase molybdenum cofactor assembly chaperone [Janthinobacterium sp.]
MKHYQVLSALLLYPEPELIAELPELERVLAATPEWHEVLRPVLDYLADTDLIALQQNYVMTFDRTPSHSLHLFEHIHGESRDRGQAMVDLMEEYKKHGLEMTGNDLPDFVPLFLEFLSQQDEAEAARLLSDAVHVLAHIGRKLDANASPYAVIFDVLERLSPVKAEPLAEPPVRDMDEALETFGPGADGVEPLLKTLGAGVQPINFHPKARRAVEKTA